MCRCTPNIRTPFCGKPGCEWPAREPISIEVKSFDQMAHKDVTLLATLGWVENVEHGLSSGELNSHYSYKAFVAYVDGAPVGVVTWEKLGSSNRLWINQSYVKPEFRRRGVYTKMWEYVVEKAKELKVFEIASGTHPNNAEMRAVAKKLGRTETGIIMSMKVG